MRVPWAPATLSVAVVLALSMLAVSAHVSGPWAHFLNLTDCHVGDTRQGLIDVKKYLHQFGYLPPGHISTDLFDDNLHRAVLSYQTHLGLNRTGTLDAPTLELMVQPRCGVPDQTAPRRRLYSFFPGRPRWPRSRTHLTYSLSGGNLTARSAFSRAFSRWADVTPLTFSEVDRGGDIRVAFLAGDHGDGEAFDGRLGTLAHAFGPPNGRLHLDADEDWTGGPDLESVAVHEIGHVLGLAHSSRPEAVMYPTLRIGSRKVDLAGDDVEGIQTLYGPNPRGNNAPQVEPVVLPETSSAAGRWSPLSALLGALALIFQAQIY